MLSQLPGVCVDVTPVRSALWRYDGEGGLNGMRRDRATQRRSQPESDPRWCHAQLHIPNLGRDALRGLLLSVKSLLTAELWEQPQSVV